MRSQRYVNVDGEYFEGILYSEQVRPELSEYFRLMNVLIVPHFPLTAEGAFSRDYTNY